jgi:hypothetical protein
MISYASEVLILLAMSTLEKEYIRWTFIQLLIGRADKVNRYRGLR